MVVRVYTSVCARIHAYTSRTLIYAHAHAHIRMHIHTTKAQCAKKDMTIVTYHCARPTALLIEARILQPLDRLPQQQHTVTVASGAIYFSYIIN